jgi:hypothetical protein
VSVDVVRALWVTGRIQGCRQIGETEVESGQKVVHETLERLGGVAQVEGHEGKLEQAE